MKKLTPSQPKPVRRGRDIQSTVSWSEDKKWGQKKKEEKKKKEKKEEEKKERKKKGNNVSPDSVKVKQKPHWLLMTSSASGTLAVIRAC